jgi:hypothetical protein
MPPSAVGQSYSKHDMATYEILTMSEQGPL